MNVKKTGLLLLVNLCLAILGVLCFWGGFLSDVLVIVLTPVAICLNYKLASGIKKMLLWDIFFLVVSGAGMFFSFLLYRWNVAADTEGILVTKLFLTIWFVVSIISILGMLTWSFRVQKKRKQESVTAGFLALSIVIVAVFGYMSLVPGEYEYSSTLFYNEGEIACNEIYEGEIGDEVVILRERESGAEKKFSKKKLGIYPQQIALGEKYFYILGGNDYQDYDTIAKVTYEGETVAKRTVGFVNRMEFRDGVLFLATKEDSMDEIPGVPGQIYADKYIKEADFERGELVDCKADKDGICQAGNVNLYDHGIYFSTNPVIPSYQECNSYFVSTGETCKGKKQTRWTELVEKMLEEKGLAKYSHEVDEYQNGNELYGVVNVRHSFLGFKDRKLKESLAYRISCETGEISVLAEKKDVFMIIASEECVVYQDQNTVFREGIPEGKAELLAQFPTDIYHDFWINGEYIQVENAELENEWVRCNLWTGYQS